MKKQLQKHKDCILFIGMLFFTVLSFGQSAGFNTTFIVFSVNGGGNTYYDLQANTGNPDFNGANLGTFCQGSNSLVFKGAEHNNYKCGSCDITSTRINYRIYPTASPSGSFVVNNIGYTSGFNNGCGGQDQRWSSTSYNTNLISGLSAGNYTIEVYSDESTTCFGTVYSSNGGSNYKATFTVNANVTYYQDTDNDGFGNPSVSQVSCLGIPVGYVTNNSDSNDNLLTYVDADGDGFGSSVKAPSGPTNSSDCNDNQIQYLDTDGDGFGSNTPVACGVTNNSDCNDNQIQYLDADGDGYGSNTAVACGVTNNSDSNDNLLTYVDADGDGFGSSVKAPSGPTNNSDCNDNQIQYLDADGDGYGSNTAVACGVTNNSDSNDNLLTYVDADGDGFGSSIKAPSGPTNNSDCNDNQIQYLDTDGDGFGSNTPVACGVTNNSDCNDNQIQYLDTDGDGFGSNTPVACGVTNNSDCNDNQIQYLDTDGDGFGSNTPVACGVTNNSDCNDNQIQYLDADGDGFGSNTSVACGVTNNSDCNDNQIQYLDADGDGFGSNTSVACGVTNNSDCNDNQIQYLDTDGDGFGSNTSVACGVTNNSDCNDNQIQYLDTDGDGFGSNTSVACGVTNNSDCNDNQIQYLDVDGDGFGSNTLVACGVINNSDCNDNQIQYLDADSDGFGSNTITNCGVVNNSDSNDNLITYVDADGDGFGSLVLAPNGPINNSDCNDNELRYADLDADGFGSTTLVACGVTNNTDCNDNQVRYLDADGDGYGSVAMIKVACGGSLVATDCDDAKASINPGAVDVCYDAIDNDCNGNIDNVGLPGGCIPKIATLQSASCGATVTALNTIVSATNVPGAQAWRFKVTNMTTLAVQTLDSPSISFQFINLPGVTFGTQYQIEVAIKYAGVWQGFYGAPCFVNTPSPVSVISSAQCGSTLTSMSQYINSSSVANVTGYRYEVTNQRNGQTQYVYSSLNKFTLTQLLSSNQTYDTNYFIRVACRNTDGSYLPEGPGCIIRSRYFPTTQVVSSLCNDYLVPSMNTSITVDPVAGATLYKFRLFNGTYDFVVESVYNRFTLGMFPGIEQGALYSVQVAVQLGGAFDTNELGEQKWGKTCTLTTPSAARQAETSTATPRLEVVVNNEFTALAYPNPFAANFKLDVTTNSEENVSVRVYDMLGKLVEDREVNATDVETLEVGANYPSGVYNVIVTQGENTKTLRVIKR